MLKNGKFGREMSIFLEKHNFYNLIQEEAEETSSESPVQFKGLNFLYLLTCPHCAHHT